MNKIITLFVSVLLVTTVSAQTTGTLRGKLVDSLNKQSLKDATIKVLDARDSTVEVAGLAKEDGSFSLLNISFGKMILEVKFAGYEPYYKTLEFSTAKPNINLGNVYLLTAATMLSEVTVTESGMRMKKDTLEINASQFKTKPNALAEDLIKKIPGMEVGKDGSIKAQGESVQRVLVNGKRFFGDDPLMATRNLPSDVIDKMQVFDDQSDQAKFSGFDDGNRVKTLNITTKKNVAKGAFGKAVASAGTDGKYDENFNLSLMNGDQQVTLMGQANDVNKQNFSMRNLGGGRGGGGFSGGGGRGGGGFGGSSGGGSGITTALGAGINYKDTWGKNMDVYGSYFYSGPKTEVESSSNVENKLFTDSSLYNNSISSSISKSSNHNFSFNMEDKIDSMNSLVFRPNFSIQNTTPNSTSSTVTTGGPNGTMINKTSNTNTGYNSGYNLSNSNLTLRHRFAKRGRTISLDLGFSASETNGSGTNYSINNFYKPTLRTDTLNQHYVDSSKTFGFNPTVSYTEPLSSHSALELRYSYSYNNSKTINRTYNFNNADQKFSTFDSLFSNSYDYTSVSNTANLSYRLQQTKYSLNLGTGLQFMNINSNNTTKNVVIDRNFVNFTPTVNFTYTFSRSKSLRFFYFGRTGQPSTTQLQPIQTTSDSVNFQIGNPNLKPQFTNSFRLLYISFDPFTQRNIFATVNANVVSNDIQNSIIQNPNGGKTTTYVNLGGTINLNASASYGFPIKKPKSNLNFTTNLGYSQSQSLLNSVSNYTRSTSLGETIKWTTNLKDNFDMNLSASTTYNPIRNTLSPNQNTNYLTYSLAADFTLYSNNGWMIASDFDLTAYDHRPAGYNTSVFLITPSIAKQFVKNKAGELRLSCFDILKQNVAISSSATANQFTTTRTNNLTRYLMLTFTYNLRNFKGQQQRGNNRFEGMRPPGGGMMMGGYGGGGGRRGGGDL